jgi:aspartate-semialdehyde dehydrogenase
MDGKQEFTVAVLGATGAVGQELISILEARGFPVATLIPLGSKRSVEVSVFLYNQI